MARASLACQLIDVNQAAPRLADGNLGRLRDSQDVLGRYELGQTLQAPAQGLPWPLRCQDPAQRVECHQTDRCAGVIGH